MKRFSPNPWLCVAASLLSFGAVMIAFLGFLSPGMTAKALVAEPHFWYFTAVLTLSIVFFSELARPYRRDEL